MGDVILTSGIIKDAGIDKSKKKRMNSKKVSFLRNAQ
jgi:hypothetical protein